MDHSMLNLHLKSPWMSLYFFNILCEMDLGETNSLQKIECYRLSCQHMFNSRLIYDM